MAEFRHLGMTVTNPNLTHERIKSTLYSCSACYHSVQNLPSSLLLSKNVKIKIHKIIILPVFLYGCEICSLTLREEHRLRVSENRMLKLIFGPRGIKQNEAGKIHFGGLHKSYTSPDSIRMIKSRKTR
jgi:hypothetical protein